MTTLEKIIEKDFSAFFVDPIAKLDKLDKEESNTQKKKKQVVIDVAMRLEQEGVAGDKICRIIIKHLKVKLKPRTIREYLPEKYKQLYKVNNAKKQKIKPIEHASIPSLAAEPPLNQKEVDTIIVDTKDKISIAQNEVTRVQSFSPVDISMIDTDLVSSSEYPPSIDPKTQSPKQIESDHSIRPNSCPECLKKNIKILELTEIIEKSENFTTADKLVDNKDIPYDFDIQFEDLRKKMQEIFRLLGAKVKVNFKGVVNSSTGETRLLFYGSPTS